MCSKITKHIPHIIGLVSLGYFTLLCAPNMTWLNTDCDGTIYLRSAKYFVLSHSTGAPCLNLLNYLVVRIPLGTEFWRLAMVSVIASSITAVLLYLIAKRYTNVLWKQLLAPAIWLGSGLVVSQSTIVETYALVTLAMTLAYYLHLVGHNKLKYLACALGLGIHHLIGFVLIPLIISDYFDRKSLKPALLSLIGIAFYVYIPLANRAPYVWIGGSTLNDYFVYFTNATGLLGGLAILPPHDLIIRLGDFGLITCGGFGIALILVVYGLMKEFKARSYLLPSLFLLPLIYYLTDFASQTYVYCLPSFAFGALLAIKHEFPMLKQYIPKLALVTCCALIVFNVHLYDIGRTLDPNLTGQQFYNQLGEVPEDALIFGRGWQVCWLYNDDHNTSIETMTSKFIVLEDKEKAIRVAKLKDFRDRDKLYRTFVTDLETQEVMIEKWTPSNEAIEYAINETKYMDERKQ